jgi:hypothetical protein
MHIFHFKTKTKACILKKTGVYNGVNDYFGFERKTYKLSTNYKLCVVDLTKNMYGTISLGYSLVNE